MDIQDTIVELFEAKRIDKTTAYRLLSESKKGSAARQAAPQQLKVKFTFYIGSPQEAQSDMHAVATWAYLLHIISGKSEVVLDHVTPEKVHTVRLEINGALSFDTLVDSLTAQLAKPALAQEGVTFAWLRPGASDAQPRLMRATCSPAAADDAAAIALELCAEPSLQDATLAADWPDTLQHLHDEMRRHGATPFAQLDLLPLRHLRLLKAYNATHHYLPPATTLPAVLDPMLAQLNDTIAVKTTQSEQCYAGYKRHAYQLAHLLRQVGARRNELVAVMLHRTARMPSAMYGVVCSGAAYVPLETDLPWERVQAILTDSASRVLVTDAETLYSERLKLNLSGVRQIVCIDGWARKTYQGIAVSDKGAIEASNATPPAPVNAPHDLGYVLFTSGSTGTPKGVMVTHQNIVNSLIGVNDKFGVGPHDRILCFSSYGFDLSVYDMFGAVLAGGSLFVASKLEIRDPFALLDILREGAITLWNSTPTGMHQLLLSFNGKNVAPINTMRIVLLGGEVIQPSLPGDLARMFPNCRLANLGGATEVTIYSNYFFPVERFEAHWKSIPYGKPLANQTMYILNDALKLCSFGEKGMIYYGGLSVASGYYHDDEKTNAAFIAAPWPDEPGGRIYRTGDLGIMRADGQMDFCGRADQQVKVRGFRVELGDIETHLNTVVDIDQAAVIAKQDDSMQYRLVAFYTSRYGELSADVLRTHLAARLPEYMIPNQFVHLVDPPVTTSGKLDRNALATRAINRDEIGREYAKPKDGMEQKLALELARILKLDRVGVDDDFFLIGGDSLISLQYMAALSELGFKASPIGIQQGRTIRGVLARATLDQQDGVQNETIDGVIPDGPMLRRFFERLPLVDRNHWNQLMVVAFDHQPDSERLDEALQAVFQHHAVLRASYQNGKMSVSERTAFRLQIVDLQQELFFLRPGRLAQEAQKLHASVGLNGDPLANALLVRLSPTDTRLMWVLHHAVVDANCWRILVDDLAKSYRQPGVRLLRSSTFADFTSMVRQAAPQAVLDLARKPHYARMSTPRLRLFGDARATNTEGDGKTLFKRFSAKETAQVLGVIRPGGVANLNLILLTALAMAMRKWCGHDEVRFDVISNGRSVDPTRDFSRTIGWFATHNPFEVSVPDSPDAVLSNVVHSWQIYQEHSRFFVEVGNDVRGDPAHPLGTQVDQALLYSHLGDFDSLEMPIGWTVRGSAGRNRGPSNPRTHDLDLETMIVGGQLMTRLVFGKHILQRSSASQLLSHFRNSLLQVVAQLEENYRVAHSHTKTLIQSPVDLITDI
jgi:amino acid adenylation domain-containing protein